MEHVTTGYDLEILLSKDILEMLIGAAYDAGIIPDFFSEDPTYSLQLDRPTTVSIPLTSVANGVEEAVFEVTIPQASIILSAFETKLQLQSITIGFDVAFVPRRNGNGGKIPKDEQPCVAILRYRNLQWPEQLAASLAHQMGIDPSNPSFESSLKSVKEAVEQSLAKKINIEIFDIPNTYRNARAARLGPKGEFQSAIGIYFNLPLKGAPPRGSIERAQTFLPNNRSFAFGSGATTVNFIGQHIWLTESFFRRGVIQDNNGKEVARHVSLQAMIYLGLIIVIYRGEIKTPWPFADVDVSVQAALVPFVEQGHLKFKIAVSDPDINVGFWNTLLGIAGGASVVSILGGLLGFDAGLSTLLGAAGGAVTIDVLEHRVERSAGESLSNQAIGLEDIFNAIPTQLQYHSTRGAEIRNRYESVSVTPYEILTYGTTTVTQEPIFLLPPSELKQSVPWGEVIAPVIDRSNGALSLAKEIRLSATTGGVRGHSDYHTQVVFRLQGPGAAQRVEHSQSGTPGSQVSWLNGHAMLPVGKYVWSARTWFRGDTGDVVEASRDSHGKCFEIAPISFDSTPRPPVEPFMLAPFPSFGSSPFGSPAGIYPVALKAVSWHPNDKPIKFEFEIEVEQHGFKKMTKRLETDLLSRDPANLQSVAITGSVSLDSLVQTEDQDDFSIRAKIEWKVRAVGSDDKTSLWVNGDSITMEYRSAEPDYDTLKQWILYAELAKSLGIPTKPQPTPDEVITEPFDLTGESFDTGGNWGLTL